MSAETRTEYTIEVTNADGSKWILIPLPGGEILAKERLRDLQAYPQENLERGQTYRLVKRNVTVTEWEPVT